MTGLDHLHADREALHEATRIGQVARGIAALALSVVALAGCMPSADKEPQSSASPSVGSGEAFAVPPGFASFLEGSGYTFTVAAPSEGAIPAQEILAIVRGERGAPPYFPDSRPGGPVYGIIDCVDAEACSETGVAAPGLPRTVWFMPLDTSGASGDEGWAVIDATTGVLIWPDG